jgi:hypothetical protein
LIIEIDKRDEKRKKKKRRNERNEKETKQTCLVSARPKMAEAKSRVRK